MRWTVLLALPVLFLSSPPSSQGQSREFLKARHSARCAQVDNASHNNGARISQWECVNQPNVRWRKRGADRGYFYLQNINSNKCAQVAGASKDNGAPITQWDCVNQANVHWREAPAGEGFVYLVNRASNKCMQVAGAG